MLKALSSTLKSESDDQSRNAAPTRPSAVAFSWIARTARRIESSEVVGNARWSSRTKNEPVSAWFAVPSSASERNRSGTNERSAKYAIIAARCVPRSAKNFRMIAVMGRQYAQAHGCRPGARRPDGDLLAGRAGGDSRPGRHGARGDRRRPGADGALRRRRA